MLSASINGHLLAESNDTIVLENNYYFPPSSVRMGVLSNSDTKTTCPWKGEALYYDATIDGQKIHDVAWYYPHTITDKAKCIEDYVAFYKNKVEIAIDD